MTAACTTLADLGPDDRAELIDGVIVQKSASLFKHGFAQGGVSGWVGAHFRRGGPLNRNAGWWIAHEVHVALAPGRVVCPDVSGWRKNLHAQLPDEWPLTVVPEWICEIVFASNASHDLETKVALYAAAGVVHYWLLDPLARRLMVYRWTAQGYLVTCNAAAEETVRAEPFDAVEVRVAELLGE